MKRKISIFLMAVLLTVTALSGNPVEVSAEETVREANNSYLWTNSAIWGYAESATKGVYLASGFSVIEDAGNGKIAAGGGTDAATFCKVSVNVIVERLSGGSWLRVTSWTGTRENAMSVMVGNIISVAPGYYYRVRCVHRAAGDSSSSMTSSLWM